MSQSEIKAKGRGGARPNSGPKPGAKYKTASDVAGLKVLTRKELKAKWRKALELAEAGDKSAKVLVEALSKITEIQHGKPYTAPAPAKPNALANDRLQDAINKLLPKAAPQPLVDTPKIEAPGDYDKRKPN